MKRTGIIAALCVASAQAFGLGAGELQVQSRLNEPLKASVGLTELGIADLRSLDVRVADADVFSRLGLEQTSAVRNLRFTLTELGGGSVQVTIQGTNPVREPYVVLLLDIRAGEGRLLREYTVLLDPASAAPFSPEPEPAEVAAQVDAYAPPSARPATPVVAQREAATAVPLPSIAQTDGADAARVSGNSPIIRGAEAAPGGRYGPVRAGATLYGIATALRPDQNVSIPQVAWALYLANPQAFEGSIDQLQRGAMLNVPSRDEMLATSASRARKNILDGSTAPRGQRVATAKPPEPEPEPIRDATREEYSQPAAPATATDRALADTLPTVAPTSRPTTRAEPSPAAEPVDAFADAPDAFGDAPDAFADAADAFGDEPDSSDAFSEPAGADGFADSGPDAFADAADGSVNSFADDGDGDAFGDDASSANAASGPDFSAGADDDGDGGLVDGLPSWLFAALGGGVVIAGLLLMFLSRRNAKADDDAMATPVVDESVGQARPAEDAFATAAMVGAQAGDDDAPELDTVSLDDAPLAADPDPDSDRETREFQAADDELMATVGLEPTSAFEGDADETLAADQDDSLDDLLATSAMATSALDTSVLDDEPSAEAEATVDVFEIEEDLDAGKASETGHDTISIDLSQDDPVSEADFHLAYGLYDEAELLLKGAIESDPDRLELREKLAETYFAAGRVDDFESVAQAIKDKAPDSDTWQKVALLGSQLAPDSALFAGAADSGAAVDMDFASDFDEPEAATETVAADDAIAADDSAHSVEFDATMAEVPAPSAPAAAEPDPGNVIEFDEPGLSSTDDAADASPDLGDETFNVDADDLDSGTLAGDADGQTLNFDADDLPDAMSESIDLDSGALELDSGSDGLSDDDLSLDFGDEEVAEDDLQVDLADADNMDAGAESGTDEALELVSDTDTAAHQSFDLGEADLLADDGGDALDIAIDDAEPVSTGADDFGSDTINIGEGTLHEAELSESDNLTADLESIDFDAGEDSVSDGDDVGGKLDLARAYIEMSELDMARSLLDEVSLRGDEGQQQEARQLLESLD